MLQISKYIHTYIHTVAKKCNEMKKVQSLNETKFVHHD